MRGFRDHRKLTMVGFRLNKGYCSFGCHETRSEVPGEYLESWVLKRLVSFLVTGSGDTVSPWEWRRKTRIQTSLGLDLEDRQVSEPKGSTLSERNKGL